MKAKALFFSGMFGVLLFMSGADLNHPLVTLIGITVSMLIAVAGYGPLEAEAVAKIKQDRVETQKQQKK